jgi:hypothetical protein
MDLREQCPAAGLDALQKPRFPQRPVAVEPLREDLPCQMAQLPGFPWLRHGGMPHVIADLEVLVVRPCRAEDVHRHGPHDLAVARHPRQLRAEQLDEIPVGGRGALEHHERAKMHRHVPVLDEEEPRIERGHPLHAPPPHAALPLRAARYA